MSSCQTLRSWSTRSSHIEFYLRHPLIFLEAVLCCGESLRGDEATVAHWIAFLLRFHNRTASNEEKRPRSNLQITNLACFQQEQDRKRKREQERERDGGSKHLSARAKVVSRQFAMLARFTYFPILDYRSDLDTLRAILFADLLDCAANQSASKTTASHLH